MKMKLIILCFSCIAVMGKLIGADLPYWKQYDMSAKKYNLDPYILYAIAEVESGNRSQSISGIGEIRSEGLMQIRSTEFSVDALFNPATNIDVGAKRLNECKCLCDSKWEAIDCYKVGISRKKGDSLYVSKVKKVLSKLGVLEK